jgi:hypothetical protein
MESRIAARLTFTPSVGQVDYAAIADPAAVSHAASWNTPAHSRAIQGLAEQG